MSAQEQVQLIHPDGKHAPRIAASKYNAVRVAILQALPLEYPGLPFQELAGEVTRLLTAADLTSLGSVGWYTTSVKLDLEARGEITRVPGSKPQRLVRLG